MMPSMFFNDTFNCWARRTCSLMLGASLIHGAAGESLLPAVAKPVEATASVWDRHEPERSVEPLDWTINSSPAVTGAPAPGYLETLRRYGLDL
jgi:hypothetical protein